MKIYNTLDRELENFEPINRDSVNMYVCGPTVYNYIHIGNARPIIFFDTVRRYLEYKGYKVNFVQNFTDIDDKIINKANEENQTYKEISKKYIKAFFEDTAKLNVKEENIIRPLASKNISDMIKFVKRLKEMGYAYEVDGDVYFNISKFEDYGKLSKQKLDELNSGARVEVNEIKKSPMDFTLWKKSKENEPFWGSPWGKGRPGWHLECSVMSMNELGETFDIHGGGQDLIFPHHENEIAQSEAYTGKPFSKYWMHNAMIKVNGEKMAKSKGNFFLLRDILKEYEGKVLRFFMLSSHYRKPIDFSREEMEMTKNSIERIENSLRLIDEIIEKESSQSNIDSKIIDRLNDEFEKSKTKFVAGMDDDFNTAIAISAIFELVKEVNTFISKVDSPNKSSVLLLKDIHQYIISMMDNILGIKLNTEKKLGSELAENLVEILIDIRKEAKKNKNWETADIVRDRLKEIGIELKDTKDKTIWNYQN